MILKNGFIFNVLAPLYEVVDNEELKFTAQVNYAIQKNIRNLTTVYQELENEKNRLCELYSTGIETTEDGKGYFKFDDEEKLKQAEKELNDLMLAEQDVNIIKFKISALGDIPLTIKQMDAIMFMIDEEE